MRNHVGFEYSVNKYFDTRYKVPISSIEFNSTYSMHIYLLVIGTERDICFNRPEIIKCQRSSLEAAEAYVSPASF